MTADQFPIRAGEKGDFELVFDLLSRAFADDFPEDQRAVEQLTFEGDRGHMIMDGSSAVGYAGAYTRSLTVPGGTLPAAHVTQVGVAPTYRRRGFLTRLMHGQLADVARRGEPLAVLWASEGKIYQRFGYGMSAARLTFEVQASQVRLTAPGDDGSLHEVDPVAAREDLERVYESHRGQRPGLSSRSAAWWEARLVDAASARKNMTKRRAIIHRGPSGVDGYALWRTKPDWDASGPRGTVRVEELAAATPQAYAALWRFLLSVDLTRTATYGYGSTDEPLLYLVDEPRRLGPRVSDGLWLRVVDLPAALSGRRYRTEVDVVLDVTDALVPGNAGGWRLRAGPEAARCERTGDPAHLSLDVAALGAAYLGGVSLRTLAAAGRVRTAGVDDAALDAASTAFGWHRAPAAVEVF